MTMYTYKRDMDGRYSGWVGDDRIPPQRDRDAFYRLARQADQRQQQRKAIKAKLKAAHDRAVADCVRSFARRAQP
jgi:hypothetical protein